MFPTYFFPLFLIYVKILRKIDLEDQWPIHNKSKLQSFNQLSIHVTIYEYCSYSNMVLKTNAQKLVDVY